MAWQIRQDAEQEAWGDLWLDAGYVFTMEDGPPLQPADVTRLFEKLRLEARATQDDLPRLAARACMFANRSRRRYRRCIQAAAELKSRHAGEHLHAPDRVCQP